MVSVFRLSWHLQILTFIFITNLSGCLSRNKSKNFKEHDLLSEMLSNGLKRKQNPSDDEKKLNAEDIQFDLNDKNQTEEFLIKQGLENILKGILSTPKSNEDNDHDKSWDLSDQGSGVRPMIRYNERFATTPKTDLDNMLEEILQRIEKSMRRDEPPSGKKKSRWRNRPRTTTDSYEHRRLKDFFTVLSQLNDLGISIEQMDHISKEPVKFKKIGESLDERQKLSMLEKLIDECEEFRKTDKISDYQDEDHDLEEVVKALGEAKGADLKRDLVKLIYALNSFVP